MTLFIAGLILFFVIHLLPGLTVLRSRIIDRVGLNAYKGLFSLITLGSMVMISIGYQQVEISFLWAPSTYGIYIIFIDFK